MKLVPIQEHPAFAELSKMYQWDEKAQAFPKVLKSDSQEDKPNPFYGVGSLGLVEDPQTPHLETYRDIIEPYVKKGQTDKSLLLIAFIKIFSNNGLKGVPVERHEEFLAALKAFVVENWKNG